MGKLLIIMPFDQGSCSRCITAVIFLFYLCSIASVSSLNDTLKPGEVLNYTSCLVSANNNFTFGFFTPFGDDNNNKIYLAIWYTYYPYPPVWTANRDNPLFQNSSFLTITSSGSLLIAHQGFGEDPFVLYSGNESSRNVSGTLLDSGNFVLKEISSNGSGDLVNNILWQSFDYPTDTLLPGMKLGVNHKTGRNWTLCSWFGVRNPASGAFTMEWDGRRLVVRRRGVVHWTSGKMKDYNYLNKGNPMRLKTFENIEKPDPANLNYNFTRYSSEDEEYVVYSLVLDPGWPTRRSKRLPRWSLNYQGNLYDSWDPIVSVSLCYGYNTQGNKASINGCQLWEQPKCRNRHQTFLLRSGRFRTSNGEYPSSVYDENLNMSLSDCRQQCWNDCKCAGYNDVEPSRCEYWMGESLRFKQSLDGYSPKFYVLDSPSPGGTRLTWILLSVLISVVLLISVAALFLRRRVKQRRKEAKIYELLTLEGYTEARKHHENEGAKGHDLRLFTYASILAATNNFSSEYKLGQGGFGPVYKGQTAEGQEMAVKLLSRSSGQGLLEFKTELILISKLQHMNLVELIGFCIHEEEKMIVYDYVPNKSLDFYLFDPSKKEQLDWSRRLNIIQGITQGLLYLHKYSRLKIVHRDLKCSNILLDKNFNPKISDFGLARIFKKDMSEANTIRRVGTYGYMAPEYAMQGIFSYKSDIYSFGVLVLEIISGRKNSSFRCIEGPLNLVEYAWELWNKELTSELMDPTLGSSCIIDQVQRCINIGLLCVENRAVDRPDIEDVISMLRDETTSLPLPQNPAFITRNSVVEEQEKSKPENPSLANELTISETRGR